MKRLTVMIKPASSLCNLRCKYCFYADISSHRQMPSQGIMTQATAGRIIDNLFAALNPGDCVDFIFQGGEPTLAGLDFFRHFAEKVKTCSPDVSVSYALQTNGTLLDDDWAAFLARHNFLVGLSLDGPSDCHNAARVDVAGHGTFKQVLFARNLLMRYGIPHNVLMVLTRQMARHPQVIWNFIQKQRLEYVQFIPCLESLDADVASPYALAPEYFASFYTEVFRLWFQDMEKQKYTSIKLFDDIVNQLAFGWITACGQDGICRPQIVVEADGSVYPCDFFAVDAYRLGNLSQQPLYTILSSPVIADFCQKSIHPQCQACHYKHLCGGGCKRMKQAVFCGNGSQLCGYQLFLNHCYEDLCRVAMLQQQLRGKP